MKYFKKTKPKIISSISLKITDKIFKKRGFKESKIITDWAEIVGKEISDLTLPIGLSKNRNLKILCNSAFALELQHMTPKIIDRINLTMGYKAVENIQIFQKSEIKNETNSLAKKQKLSKKEMNQLTNVINTVDNMKIKEKFKDLSKTIFTSKE